MVAGDSRIALFTVNGLRQDASYGCLSHSSGPGEQVGVSQPLRLDGVYQCLGDVILADDILKHLRTPLSGQHFISHIQPSQSFASGWVPVLSDGQIVNGGERGIRTLGTTFSWYTRFPVALLRPTRTSLRVRTAWGTGGFECTGEARVPATMLTGASPPWVYALAERVGFEPTCPAIHGTSRFRVDPVTTTSVPLRHIPPTREKSHPVLPAHRPTASRAGFGRTPASRPGTPAP